MKRKKLEKLLLLEESGELSARQRRLLEVCSEARAKRAEMKALCEAVPVSDAEPGVWDITKISARLREEPHSVFAISTGWKPALALAACLAIVAGFLIFNRVASSYTVVATAAEVIVWDDQFEEDLVELESLILAMSGDPLDIMEL